MLGKAKGRVLDVGCGTGGLLEELRQAGCDVCGIELNPDSVKTCLDKGLNVQSGTLLNTDFPDNTFDTVLLWHALEHLISARKSLETIMRILKPGGRVFIYSPNAESYIARYFRENWWAWHVPFHFYHFTPATIRRLAEEFGYIVVKCGSKTPEHFVRKSIETLVDAGRRGTIFRIVPRFFYRTLVFRLMAAPVFRLLDLAMPGRGECIAVELQKPGR
jgi:SAM-dependent methyltransferase